MKRFIFLLSALFLCVEAFAVKEYKLYSATPEEESAPTSEESAYSLVGEQEFLKTDGEYDPLVILFVCLALVFCADWMVYCYEKYQLR